MKIKLTTKRGLIKLSIKKRYPYKTISYKSLPKWVRKSYHRFVFERSPQGLAAPEGTEQILSFKGKKYRYKIIIDYNSEKILEVCRRKRGYAKII